MADGRGAVTHDEVTAHEDRNAPDPGVKFGEVAGGLTTTTTSATILVEVEQDERGAVGEPLEVDW